MQRLGFVVTPGFPVMSLAALAAFEFANSSIERPFYDVGVLSEAGGRVPSSLGLAIETKRFGSAIFDSVIVTGTMDVVPRAGVSSRSSEKQRRGRAALLPSARGRSSSPKRACSTGAERPHTGARLGIFKRATRT